MTASGRCLRVVVAAALYGFSIGAVHSWRFALLNLVKFPLLISVSILICGASYCLVARLVAPRLRLGDVARLVLDGYGDTSMLLASLSTVCLFFARTIAAPTSRGLGEYPTFLALNVVAIAGCGVLALGSQATALLRRYGLDRIRAVSIVTSWLALSLVVGGQWAWYLRPFFGNRAVPDDGSFCLGSQPDFRGAESFYEAVHHLIAPPP